MNKLITVILFTFALTASAFSQITWTYSTRDAMNWATGDSANAHPKWRKIIDTSGGSPQRNLKGATAAGGAGQAATGFSSLGSGDRAGAFWDSAMVMDTNSFSFVWKQNEDSSYTYAIGSTTFYFGLNDSNRQRWRGLAFRVARQNPGSTNGGDYRSSFYKVDSTTEGVATGNVDLFSGGFALRQNDTLRVVNHGGSLWAYWVRGGGAGTTLIDSVPYSALNAAYLTNPGRIAVRSRVSAVPPMFNTFQIGTKSGAASPGILRDTIPPVITNVTPSFSVMNTQTFTISAQITDSNTTTQKNPGVDSIWLKFGTTYAIGQGGAPDTVVGDSVIIKAGTTKDTVISKLFSAKSVGTYYYQIKAKDDTANTRISPRQTLVVGTVAQNPFKIHGYFYVQTLSSWWPAIEANPSILGDLATNQDILYWFYDNPDTLFPHLRARVPDQGNAQYPNGSMAADSARLFGWTRSSGTRNIMYQFRDSMHAHGNKFVLAISAVVGFAPATAVQLQIIVNDTTKSKNFASTLGKFCNLHKIDGIDFNWEFPAQSNKAFMFQFFKKLKDSLTVYSWDGQPPIISLDLETQSTVVGNQSYDFSALDSLCTYVSVVSRDRFSYASPQYTANPRGVSRPRVGSTYGLPGDTVKGFDMYSMSDTTWQNGLTYITVNGLRAGGIRASKAVQVLGFGAYEVWGGASGPGQSASGVTFGDAGVPSGQLGESNNGSSAQTYLDQYWSPMREWRDSTNNHYLGYRLPSNAKRTVIYDDSVSLGELVKHLKSRGFSGIMYNEAAWLQNSAGWRGNNDRLSFLKWMRAAADAPTFTTVGMPAPVAPTDGSTNQGSPSAGTMAVTFRWNKVSNANEGYHISVSADGRFNTAVGGADQDVGTTSTDTTVTISGLASNSVFYWKVVGRMGRFYGYYSRVHRFTTGSTTSTPTRRPYKPQLVAPANAATGQATSVTLKWHQPAGIVDTIRSYWFQIGVDPNFATWHVFDSLASPGGVTLPDTQYTVTGLSQGGTYYWHVKAVNAVGDSGYSSNFSFTTSIVTPSSVPSFKRTFRWFDDSTLTFRNDAAPPMLMRDFAFNNLRPPRKRDGTLDTLSAFFTPRGVMFWDSTFYDFSKAGNYLLSLGSQWTAYQEFLGGLSAGSFTLTGGLNSNIVPGQLSLNVGQWGLGTAASPFDSTFANKAFKVYQRNGSYTTDEYAIKSEMLQPNSGHLLWEEFIFNGSAAKTVLRSNTVISAVGQNRWNVHAGSQATAGGGIQYVTPTPATVDSLEPGMMAINLNGAGTLGAANGGAFSFKGDSTFGTINPRINGLVITGKFFIPATNTDSLGIGMGLAAIGGAATDSNKSFIVEDTARAGLWIERSGRLTNAQVAGTADSICAVASAGTAATRTKVRLVTATVGLWYHWKIESFGTNAIYTIWSQADNFTTPTTTTIVTNLPAATTQASPFCSAWNRDALTTKQVRFGFYGLFLSKVQRGGQ